MANLPKPSKLAIACPPECSLHPSKIGSASAAAFLAMRENGAGRLPMIARSTELLGYTVASGTMSRHLKHYREVADPAAPVFDGPKPSDLEIIDSIIVAGFRNSKNWKPTIRDTLDAMKLKVQMTGNSAFDDLLSLFDAAEDPEPPEDALQEAPEAILSPEERPDDHDEDLGEPLAGE